MLTFDRKHTAKRAICQNFCHHSGGRRRRRCFCDWSSSCKLDIASIVNRQPPIQRWNCRVSAHCYLWQRSSLDAGQCVTENRSVTRVDALVAQSGQEVPSAGGNVRPLPGPLLRLTGGELAVDGRPIQTNSKLRQIESNVQNLQLSSGHPLLFAVKTLLPMCESY